VVPLSGTGVLPTPVVIAIVVFGAVPTQTLASSWDSSALVTDVEHAEVDPRAQSNELDAEIEPGPCT
jgi:hypothetical protein